MYLQQAHVPLKNYLQTTFISNTCFADAKGVSATMASSRRCGPYPDGSVPHDIEIWRVRGLVGVAYRRAILAHLFDTDERMILYKCYCAWMFVWNQGSILAIVSRLLLWCCRAFASAREWNICYCIEHCLVRGTLFAESFMNAHLLFQ